MISGSQAALSLRRTLKAALSLAALQSRQRALKLGGAGEALRTS